MDADLEREARAKLARMEEMTPGWREQARASGLTTVLALAEAMDEVDRLRAELAKRGFGVETFESEVVAEGLATADEAIGIAQRWANEHRRTAHVFCGCCGRAGYDDGSEVAEDGTIVPVEPE